MLYIPQLVLIFLLILAGGFFTAAEYAIIAVRKTRIDSLARGNHALAKRVRDAMRNREEYISTTQLGATIVNLIIGWTGEPILAQVIGAVFSYLRIRQFYFIDHFIAIILSFCILTFFSILFSELIPKTIALRKSEGIAFATIIPMAFFSRLFKPFTNILNAVEGVVLKMMRINSGSRGEMSHSKEELRVLMDEVMKIGIISPDEKQIVNNVFQMNERSVKQLLKPRSEIHAIDGSMTIDHLLKKVNSRYSRYPVYLHTIDNIIGFIHIKDFYHVPHATLKTKLSQSGLLRNVISIPDTKKINEVFLDMRRRHVHMAIIYSEYGTVLGMVTLEDIVESVLGDIQDEFDRNLPYMRRNNDGSYVIDGSTPIKLFAEKFNVQIATGATTLGGYVFHLLGHEPHVGDKVDTLGFIVAITAIHGKRIAEMRLTRKTPPT